MSKTVNHYLRDYLKLKGSSKYSIRGGAERLLDSTEKALPYDQLIGKFFTVNPPSGSGSVFTYAVKPGMEADLISVKKDLVAHLLTKVPTDVVLTGGRRLRGGQPPTMAKTEAAGILAAAANAAAVDATGSSVVTVVPGSSGTPGSSSSSSSSSSSGTHSGPSPTTVTTGSPSKMSKEAQFNKILDDKTFDEMNLDIARNLLSVDELSYVFNSYLSSKGLKGKLGISNIPKQSIDRLKSLDQYIVEFLGELRTDKILQALPDNDALIKILSKISMSIYEILGELNTGVYEN